VIYLALAQLAAIVALGVLLARGAQASPDLENLIALVDRLCQRVQAPDLAVTEHAFKDTPPSPRAVPFDDDEAFYEAQLTKEQLAHAAYEAELAS